MRQRRFEGRTAANPVSKADEKFSFKQVPLAFASLPRALRLVWSTSWRLTLALGFLNVLQGIIPAISLSITALVVDSVVQAIRIQNASPLWWPVGLQLVVTLGSSLLSALSSILQLLLQELVSNKVQMEILRKASTLDLAFFENPESYDTIRQAANQSSAQTSIIMQGFSMGQTLVTLVTLLFLLFHLAWWLALVALVTPLPAFFFSTKYGWKGYWLTRRQSPERRLLSYLMLLMTTDTYHKEIQLFNLSDFLIARFWNLATKLYEQDKNLALRQYFTNFGWSNLSSIANSGIYLYVALQAVAGRITLGGLTLYTQTATRVGGNFRNLLNSISSTYQNALYVNLLFEFLGYQPAIHSPALPQPFVYPEQSQGLSIEFRNVSFTYPGKNPQTEAVLRQVSFIIRAGEAVALVGHNGAGKTTLVKLLTRLYEPDEGEILIGGKNIKDYHLKTLRQHIGVIFQDYVNYQMTARENIGVGRIEEIENDELVRKAAGKSGANKIIEKLPRGYETALGRWFKDLQESTQLSGGEWQKIALARAFMREAHVLVLDEPTSSLDARAEYEIFEHFRALIEKRTALFISHRFSTVRLADRIFVLEHGRLIESGSHEELIDRGERYAELFHLQAKAYR
ncbi:MAG TPA: ABC transporter ATP-binding protein [Ktedonobacteraceae bacterium]|nr:ABC transporter ATP-binding protein [Ktedonobacteraceae bacterium]